jgi:peptide deformylase
MYGSTYVLFIDGVSFKVKRAEMVQITGFEATADRCKIRPVEFHARYVLYQRIFETPMTSM